MIQFVLQSVSIRGKKLYFIELIQGYLPLYGNNGTSCNLYTYLYWFYATYFSLFTFMEVRDTLLMHVQIWLRATSMHLKTYHTLVVCMLRGGVTCIYIIYYNLKFFHLITRT